MGGVTIFCTNCRWLHNPSGSTGRAPIYFTSSPCALAENAKGLRGFKQFKLLLLSALKVYLQTLPCMMFILLITLFFTMVIFFVEPRSNIESYPMAMWLVVVTMATVGYGDV